LAPDRIQRGSGRTTEITSEIVRFSSFERLAPEATELELSIHWPVALQDGTKLQLVLHGKAIWDGAVFGGMRITKHEFRTRATKGRIESVPQFPESVRAFLAAGAGSSSLPRPSGLHLGGTRYEVS
jgi:hypothetical protein